MCEKVTLKQLCFVAKWGDTKAKEGKIGSTVLGLQLTKVILTWVATRLQTHFAICQVG